MRVSCSGLSSPNRIDKVAWAGAGIILLSAGLVVLVYYLPWGYNVIYHLNHSGSQWFASATGIGNVQVSPICFTWTGLVLACGLWLFYGISLWCVSRSSCLSLPTLLIVPAVVAFLFVFIPPVFSLDVEVYVMHARVWHLRQASPYVLPPSLEDPLFLLRPWLREFVYGPLSLLATSAVVRLAGGSMVGSIVGLKILGATLHIATTCIIWRTAAIVRPGSENVAAVMYGWNPLILLEVVGNAHNDGLMVALLVCSLWFYAKGKSWRGVGWMLAVGSALVKYSSLPFCFFYIISWWKHEKDKKKWARQVLVIGSFSLFFLVGLFLLLPLGSLRGLLRGLTEEAVLFRRSPVSALPIPLQVVRGLGGEETWQTHDVSMQAISVFALIAGGLLILWQAVSLGRQEGTTKDLVTAWGVTILTSLVFLSPSFYPWYICWLAPVVSVWQESEVAKRLLAVTGLLGFVLMAFYFVPI